MLKNVLWAEDRDYKTGSEDEPLQFYIDALCNSSQFDLLLGYFSSSALNILALGFANFIYSGGKMRAIINDVLSEDDKNAIASGQEKEFSTIYNFHNIKELAESLDKYGRHFFECFAWLIANEKIQIKIIKPKNGKGISHYKSGIFGDGIDKVGFKSSCNFSAYGLLENLEELNCRLSWEDDLSNRKIKKQTKYFEEIFSENADFVEYLNIDDVKAAIRQEFGNKDIQELLVQEQDLISKRKSIYKNVKIKKSLENAFNQINKYDELEFNPKFPHTSGPRDYQTKAYSNWLANGKKGLFAMATGTGKTLTSLNCVLEEYKKSKFYKIIVLVPSISLASQWKVEIRDKFNFESILVCSSKVSNWQSSLKEIGKNVFYGTDKNYAIVLTYATFKGVKFQSVFKELFVNDFDKIIVIADEAHTMGAKGLLKKLPNYIDNRIGLSATPERQYDEIGELELNTFFNSSPPHYTFCYDMKKAIEDKVLCEYYYYPKIVELDRAELDSYLEISKKLLKYLDFKTGKYKDDPNANLLLIQRKNIIHKAKNKVDCLINIVKEIGPQNFKNAFIYVPEGIDPDFSEIDVSEDIEQEKINEKLISNYTEALSNNFNLKLRKFTGETKDREEILEQFSSGKLDALLAMKCLDEGVDIPQTKYAIFCSSTGNPRQYIQRRGRVLRNYKGKKNAIIYDMIVKPVLSSTTTDSKLIKAEKNIFLNELRRFVNFAVLSINKDESLKELEDTCYSLGIDIYELANQELEKYKTQ